MTASKQDAIAMVREALRRAFKAIATDPNDEEAYYLLEAESALDEWERENGWRPIEEAPKDGTKILLFSKSWEDVWETIQVAHFEGDGEGGGCWAIGGPESDAAIDSSDEDYQPTHFRPLPPPPRSE